MKLTLTSIVRAITVVLISAFFAVLVPAYYLYGCLLVAWSTTKRVVDDLFESMEDV